MKFTGSLPGVRFDVAATLRGAGPSRQASDSRCVAGILNRSLGPDSELVGGIACHIQCPSESVGVNTEASGGGVSAGEADSTGSVVLGDNGIYSFTYTTSLTWLTWNEFHDANEDPDSGKWPPPAMLHSPGPYGSQMLGMAAALNFLADYDFFPGVTITSNPIKVG